MFAIFTKFYHEKENHSGGSRISHGNSPTRGGGGANLLFGLFFAENYIKMKKIWTERGRASPAPLDPPLSSLVVTRLTTLSYSSVDNKVENKLIIFFTQYPSI